MALSDTSIRRFIDDGKLTIQPFDPSRLTPSGYDLAVCEDVGLQTGERRLVATLERVELPDSLLGILHLRSTFAREGLIASLALVDPGFRGQLTVSLFNAGKKLVNIESGERFLQITFIELTLNANRPYDGQYQESLGVVESRRIDPK